jgi:hypothetical protein
MAQDPLVKEQFWPHLLPQIFQNWEIKVLVNSVTRWDKLLMHNPFAIKEKSQALIFHFDICTFLLDSTPGSFQCMLYHYVSGSY